MCCQRCWVRCMCGLLLIQNSAVGNTLGSAAINLFITNIIGLGLGPFTVGFFSDVFSHSHGEDGLRWEFGDDDSDSALGCFLLFTWRCGIMIKRAQG